MKKIEKTMKSAPRSKRSASRPNVISIDELAVLQDADLSSLIDHCNQNIQFSSHDSPEAKEWEVELMYALREREIRIARMEAHSKWMTAHRPQFESFDDTAF